MSFNLEQVECPICFDQIGEKNNITTECGHKFHASCLMTNITRNGFGCPCCRSVMAEPLREEEEWSDEEEDYSDDESILLDDENDELYSDYALLGLRLFTNGLENQDNTEEDMVAEDNYQNPQLEPNEDSEPIVQAPPPHNFVTNSLREQGVTYEQLAVWILMDHDEYNQQLPGLEAFASDIWGKLRIIISNYSPVVEPVVEQVVEPEPETTLFDFQPIESPIPNFEWYDLLLSDDDDSFYTQRGISITDFDELRVDLGMCMVDYSAQPKTPICV